MNFLFSAAQSIFNSIAQVAQAVVLALLPPVAPVNDNQNPATIVFVNGLNNTLDDSLSMSLALKKDLEAKGKKYVVDLAFNKTEGVFLDFLQAFSQKMVIDNLSDFWKLIDNVDNLQNASLVTDEIYQKYINDFKKDEMKFPEIEDHIKEYNKYLAKNSNVVLVPHSQGNFYANASLNLLFAHSTIARKHLFSVGIATPSNKLLPNSSYFTSSNDSLIVSIGVGDFISSSLSILPPNITIPYSDNDKIGHGFLTSYLREGQPSKDIILDKIIAYADKK
ncbi:MAG: hypothetical protein ACN6N1_09280 [Acinetobacter guillouiae]|uniref:hypothetical protein n=1 Tax=Acinetobacter sp. 1125_18A TaxID=2605959 RepID=UPI003E0B3A10